MQRILLTVLVAIVLSACQSSAPRIELPAEAPEIERPFARAANVYYRMLLARRFEDLDRIADDARKRNAAIADGQPVLGALYAGVGGCMSNGCEDGASPEGREQRRALLLEWRALRPDSVTGEIAYSVFLVENAWAMRGYGPSSTVSAEGWAGFRTNMDAAREQLDGASGGAKHDPGWYDAMLSVGLASGWPAPRYEALYREGTTRHPLYLPIYFNATRFFMPRWYGSRDALKRFVDAAAEATGSTLGETMYARLHWSLSSQEMFLTGQTDWARMRTGFERIVAEHPDPWNINNFARFACLAGDTAKVLELSERIRDKPIRAAWWGDVRNYGICVDFARSRSPAK